MIDVLYVYIVGASQDDAPDYAPIHARFIETYKLFRPEIPHRLVVCIYNGIVTPEIAAQFDGLDPMFIEYHGHGGDVGAYQWAAQSLDSDLTLFCNTQVHFHRAGWLERLVEAREFYGKDGIYGPSASFENNPHMRTGCFATAPKLLRDFPYQIRSRAESFQFEHGVFNFTRWVREKNLPTVMITWQGYMPNPTCWRLSENTFRRGDQSNCIIWDRHTKVFADADAETKLRLTALADGLNPDEHNDSTTV